MISSKLISHLETLKAQGLYRSRRIFDDKTVVNFCSNDYLGLAKNETVIAAFKKAVDIYGIGSGSAHLICGHSNTHHVLEEELAEFTGRERALLFSTGYMANVGTINALLERGDNVFEDKLNHASLIDGGLSSGANFKRYPHADLKQLEKLLSTASGQKLIVTDGVFSMDGDVAPLRELTALSKQNAALLMVDEAHGFGVLGKTGGGLIEQLNLTQNDVPILMGTLGKAFGTFGAFVAGSETLIETLIQSARTYIYTTALPPAIAEATRASLKIVIHETWRREKLQALITQFKTGAEQLNLPLMPSDSPIQPLLIGDSFRATQISQQLLESGFLVSAIRPPTVPKNKARLRITLSALHEFDDVSRLLETLHRLQKNLK
ncbi:MAG: 8-amino-7-oxononanoate synthase [Methylococcales bacterium]|nr:8-amino-7-oxononanoate synthase [Methylococcales bacterium]MDD5755250.1 8-amino-7-oxononanoate synthase [Methylococcales bacterium]